MPIKLVTGDILRDHAEAIVIPVNTLGLRARDLPGSGRCNTQTNIACMELSAKTNVSTSAKSCR